MPGRGSFTCTLCSKGRKSDRSSQKCTIGCVAGENPNRHERGELSTQTERARRKSRRQSLLDVTHNSPRVSSAGFVDRALQLLAKMLEHGKVTLEDLRGFLCSRRVNVSQCDSNIRASYRCCCLWSQARSATLAASDCEDTDSPAGNSGCRHLQCGKKCEPEHPTASPHSNSAAASSTAPASACESR